jgi:hypothetical protein
VNEPSGSDFQPPGFSVGIIRASTKLVCNPEQNHLEGPGICFA